MSAIAYRGSRGKTPEKAWKDDFAFASIVVVRHDLSGVISGSKRQDDRPRRCRGSTAA
jgi:hypothetical protein